MSFVDVFGPPDPLACISGGWLVFVDDDDVPFDVLDDVGSVDCDGVDDSVELVVVEVVVVEPVEGEPVDVEPADGEPAGDEPFDEASFDDGSVLARATPVPWPALTAAPTPSATASAPTRPTYLA